jgi:hypothetical protein
MEFKIQEHPMLPGSWEVSWLDDDNGVHLVLFGGYKAEDYAYEYKKWKESQHDS